jgi:hypothetical protein
LLFVAAAVVGFGVLIGGVPRLEEPVSATTHFLEASGARVYTGGWIQALGAAALLIFAGRLRHLCRSSDPLSWLAPVGFAGIAISVGLTYAGGALGASAFYLGQRELDPHTAQALLASYAIIHALTSVTDALWLGIVGVLLVRSSVLPRWVGWSAIGVAIVMLGSAPSYPRSIDELPSSLFLVWIVAASITLLRVPSEMPDARASERSRVVTLTDEMRPGPR